MTSSIFRPRRSRAWVSPSTHLKASTMFVLPDPFGPTIAVMPPSKAISVERAKVLKPESVIARRCTAWPRGYQILGSAANAALDRARWRRGVGQPAGLHLAQGRPGRVLLGRLLGGAVAGSEGIRAGVDDGGVLPALAVAAGGAVVEGRDSEALLDHLLQAALEVLVLDRLGERPEAVEIEVIGRVVAGVKEDRAEHRLESVRQQRFQAPAAALRDALAEVQVVADVELLRHRGEGVGVHHRGADLRQLALLRVRPDLVQVLGGDQLQHRVTEVLQALVVPRRHLRALVGERAVRQGLEEKRPVTEGDPDLLLQFVQGTPGCLGAPGYEPDSSWMYSQAWPTVVIFSASSSGISSPVFSSKA